MAVRGRASRGLFIAYNIKRYSNVEVTAEHNNCICINVSICNQLFIIGNVYINQATDTQTIFNDLDEVLQMYSEVYKEASIIIGGDFNARVADKGVCDENQLPATGLFSNKRESLDNILNNRGLDLLDFCQQVDFCQLFMYNLCN